jgi:hypothetical protein
MKKITLQKLNDPGHGWYSVPLSLINKLKINLNAYEKITTNPKGTRVYFEEDCEYENIFSQIQNLGISIAIKDLHTNKQSKVRNYPVVTLDYLKQMRPHFFQ